MRKVIPTLAVAGFALIGLTFNAQATPPAPLVGGCGPGFHRGLHNACMRDHVLRCVMRPTPSGPRRICS